MLTISPLANRYREVVKKVSVTMASHFEIVDGEYIKELRGERK